MAIPEENLRQIYKVTVFYKAQPVLCLQILKDTHISAYSNTTQYVQQHNCYLLMLVCT